MVSLGGPLNFNSSGASFFRDSSAMDNDPDLFFQPILTAEDSESSFKPLKTVPVFSFHLLVSFVISLCGVILAIAWQDEKRCEAYFIMLYLRVAFWFVTFIFDHIVKYHHERLRMRGYHEFHKATNVHKSMPFYIVSLWNAAIMGVQTLIQHFYGEHFGEHCVEAFLSPIVYLTMFSGLETLLIAAVHGSYIFKVRKFNRLQSPPDVMRGNQSMQTGSVGVTQRAADMAELLEKQADEISYLKDHNQQLKQKIMQLHSQVRVVQYPPPTTSES